LLDQGAQPDVRPAAYDWSPLELAIHNGRRETAALLVERGASIELWSAAALGDVARIVELARREPVSVNARGPNGTPALGFAASIAAVDALLAAGADALAPDVNGNLPHQVLVGYPERREAARYLLARTGLPVELSFLCADGDLEGIERALQESPEAIERYGRPYDGAARLCRGALPLHVAVLHGQLSVASWLLDRGARVDARTRDGQTALHLAAGAGELALAELLLERGADPHAVETQHGSTPLGWAEFHHARLNGPDSCLAVAALLRARMVD
jgi:ankyrin repeat protein